MKISIIIINHSGLIDTTNCIESMRPYLSNDKEIICVDNSNTNDDFLQLKKKFKNVPNIKIIQTKNYGFGNACNFGAHLAQGDYLLFINNDTVVNSFNLDFDSLNPNTIYSGLVLNTDGSTQRSYGSYFKPLDLFLFSLRIGKMIRNHTFLKKLITFLFPKKIEDYKNPSIDNEIWVSGCLLLVEKNRYLNLNGFDEGFFMYLEDQDLCRRHINNNGQIAIIKSIQITHFAEKSSEKNSRFIKQKRIESALYYFNKHFPSKRHILLKLIIRTYYSFNKMQ